MEPLDQAPPSVLPPLLAPSTTFKNRRPWLIVFGLAELLIALALLFLGFSMVLIPQEAIKRSQPPGAPEVSMWPLIGIYAAFGTVWGVLGIGTILAKNWARIGSLIAAYFWAVIGVISTLVMAVMVPTVIKRAGTVPAESQMPLIVGMLVFLTMVMVLLPGIFIAFFHGRNVRATCLDGQQPSGSPRPILITVLIVLFALALLSGPFSLLSHYPAVIFGIVIGGVPGKIIVMVSLLAEAVALWGFLKLDIRGWWVATLSSAFWCLSYLSICFRHGDVAGLYEKMGISAEYMQSMKNVFAVAGFFVFVMVFAKFAAILYSKRYFSNSSLGFQPTSSEPRV